MKTLPKYFLLITCLSFFMLFSAQAQTSETKEQYDYLIVVSNSRDKAANEKVLNDVKATFEDAGLYYDEETKQYYVYVERYYAKSEVVATINSKNSRPV